MSRNTSRRQLARKLRREMPPAEAILWKALRGRRLRDFKFRRQHPIGPYFADMACLECKLVVELDGETHLGQADRDERRTEYLQSDGWLVLRFWNTELYDDNVAVLEAIYQECERRRPPLPHPKSTSPR